MSSGFQKGQNDFCRLSGSIENHGNAGFSPNFVRNVETEVGIYKRKQELDQENDQEKKKVLFSISMIFNTSR